MSFRAKRELLVQEWPARHVVPAPLAGLAEEAEQGADVRIPRPAAERQPITGVDVDVHMREETLEVNASAARGW
jgi:hypothetical protein